MMLVIARECSYPPPPFTGKAMLYTYFPSIVPYVAIVGVFYCGELGLEGTLIGPYISANYHPSFCYIILLSYMDRALWLRDIDLAVRLLVSPFELMPRTVSSSLESLVSR
ncbi:hypothetical protein F5Y08DRAFT_52004 [Xylaria arbuscula]|nr:hypothetical protein F5Y08DRAFT_52004 [Xylaria arbuscula]